MKTISLGTATNAWSYDSQLYISEVSKNVFAWLQSPWTLLSFKLVIGLVSALDIFLTIKYVSCLPALEMNPIGRWMMSLDSGPECELDQAAVFIAFKFMGNFLTLAVIELVAWWRRPHATIVACSVAFAQIVLLYYLLYGDNAPIPMP